MKQPTKLMNRNFFLLWQGQFVSRLGSQVVLIALAFWIKHTTDSATLIGLIQMLSSLPAVALGPIGGTFADRRSRRTIIILSDVLRGVAVLSLAGLMFVVPNATGTILVWLSSVLVFTSVVTSFFDPAISAAIPDLVPRSRITGANSLGQLSFQLSVFIGQGLGGTLFRLLGAPVLFIIDGVTYLFSAVSESFITIPQTMPQKGSHWREQFREFKQDTWEGFRYVWNKAGLRDLIFVSAVLTFFTMPVITLLPFYVEDFLKVKPDWYGFLLVAYGVGALVGYLLAGLVKLSGQTRGRWMMACILLQSAGYGLIGLIQDPSTALVLAVLGGATGGFFTVNITSVLQITTPGEIRGRVFGLLGTLSGSLAPIAMGLSGVTADLLGQNIPLIYVSCGVIMTVLSLAVFLNQNVRSYLAYEQEVEVPQIIESQAVP
jgi:DHA3 family macrolide efflux protein-like MFS transporter